MSTQTLFQRLCSEKLLLSAWEQVKSKNAAGGVDKRTVDDFAKDLPKQIERIVTELKSGTWKPQPYLRVENPYDSVIHARQSGKPTFVYDVVELFRAQAVDRVVFLPPPN